jgi:hypothetical protein
MSPSDDEKANFLPFLIPRKFRKFRKFDPPPIIYHPSPEQLIADSQ